MLEGKTGKLPVKVSVFRNPIEEMAATVASLNDCLSLNPNGLKVKLIKMMSF